MNKLFYKEIEYDCDFGNKTLTEILREWDRSRELKNMVSYKLYFKKIINEDHIILNRFVSKVFESQDIHVVYVRNKKKMILKIKPVWRSYLLFVLIPVSAIILANSDKAGMYTYLLPVLIFIALIFFFKYLIRDEAIKIKKELNDLFFQKKISFKIIE